MSIRKLFLTALLALSVCMLFSAYAQAATLELINRSSSEIHAVYISDSGTDDWEENIIDGYLLPPGNSVDIRIPSYNNFDLRVEDEEGNAEDYTEFPGRTRQITIKGGGNSSYR